VGLDADRAFLKAGGVLRTTISIDSYIDLKMESESDPLRAHPASGRVRNVLLGMMRGAGGGADLPGLGSRGI